MKFKTQGIRLLLILISFGLFYILDTLYFDKIRNWIYVSTESFGIGHIISYSLVGLPIYIGTYLIASNKSIVDKLGLNSSLRIAVPYAIFCVLPMFVGFIFLYPINLEINTDVLLIKVLSAGFFEELFFRAFLFGMIYKFTKLGFIPSVLTGSIIFGLLHLYQSTVFVELLGIFGVTFAGAIIFAWAYAEWKFNIWVPILLHMLMNLAWEIFNISDNALGNLNANIFRFITIVLIFIITIIYKKNQRINFEITKKTIWIKRDFLNKTNGQQ